MLVDAKSRPAQSDKLVRLWATGVVEVVAAMVAAAAEVANRCENHPALRCVRLGLQ